MATYSFSTTPPSSEGEESTSFGKPKNSPEQEKRNELERRRQKAQDMMESGGWGALGMTSPPQDFMHYFTKSLANQVIGTADLLPGVNIPKITSREWGRPNAPENEDENTLIGRVGGLGGDLFGMNKAGGVFNEVKNFPKVAGALGKAEETIRKFGPTGERLMDIVKHPLTKSILSNSAFGAVMNPENQVGGALGGGLFGAVGHGLGAVLGTQNPVFKGLAGAALGAMPGYYLGGKTGAEIGGVAGTLAALSPGNAGRAVGKFLSGINKDEVAPTMKMAREEGIDLRPTEVTGKPEQQAYEGSMEGVPANQLQESQVARQGQEKNWIDKMLDMIHPGKENVGGETRDMARKIQGEREAGITNRDQGKVDAFLHQVHPETEDVSEKAQQAATNMIVGAKSVRAANTTPSYNEFKAGVIPEKLMTGILKDPNLEARYNDVASADKHYYDRKENKLPINTLGTVETMRQDLKLEIKAANKSENFKEARLLKQQLKSLDDMMEEHVFMNNEAAVNARELYKAESIPVNKLTKGAIGKISKMNEQQLKGLSQTIFDRKQTNMEKFKHVQTEFEKADPDLWQRMVRNEMDRRLALVKSGDPAAIFHKNFLGSERDFQQFSEAVKNIPGAKDALAQMRTEFPKSAKELAEMRKPMIAKIANMKDAEIKNISKNIFDPNQTDIKMFTELRDQISKENPDTWLALVRNEMVRRMSKPSKDGGVLTHFTDTILGDENNYRLFHEAFKGMPEIQQKLARVKEISSKILNPLKKGQVVDRAATTGNVHKGFSGVAHKALKFADSLLNGSHDKALVALITDPKWDSKFGIIDKMKNWDMKAEKFGELLGKIGTAATAS